MWMLPIVVFWIATLWISIIGYAIVFYFHVTERAELFNVRMTNERMLIAVLIIGKIQLFTRFSNLIVFTHSIWNKIEIFLFQCSYGILLRFHIHCMKRSKMIDIVKLYFQLLIIISATHSNQLLSRHIQWFHHHHIQLPHHSRPHHILGINHSCSFIIM